MRKRVWITCSVALLICLLLLILHGSKEQRQISASQQGTSPGNPPGPTTNYQPKEKQHQVPGAVSNGLSALENPQSSRLQASNARYQQVLSDWQAPIDFYGKVIDENSNAIAGASVQFSWTEIPLRPDEKASTQSDSEGLFSLRNKRGPTLNVSVGKEGYYATRPQLHSFSYALGSDRFSPDPQTPVVFRLRKKGIGEQLIHVGGVGLHTMRDFLLNADGKPTEVSLRDGRSTPAGGGDVKVEFKAGPALDNSPSRITWQCQITIPGGGLISTDEEFPFLAPESGYQPSDDLTISGTNWTEEVDKQYYVQLPNGYFGRVNLHIIGVADRPFFRMESFLNPTGSRDLEPAP